MATIEEMLRDAYTHWDDADTLSRLGRELQMRSRLEDARRVLGRAVALNPKDIDAWAELGYAHLRGFSNREGYDVLRKGIAATGSDALKAALASFTSDKAEADSLWKELETSKDPSAVAARLSHRFFSGDDKAAQFSALERLQVEHPENADVRDTVLWTLIMGKHRGFLGDIDIRTPGVPLAEKKAAAEPDRLLSYWFLVQLHQIEKDWDKVLAVADRALAVMPDEETVMQYKARAHLEKGDEDTALHWFSRAIGAKPSFAGARVDLGKLYEKQGKLDMAERLFREIPRMNPDYPMSRIELALYLSRHGGEAEAERLFLEAWPGLPEGYRKMLKNKPEAAPLLARDAVKALIEA